ncbi:ABC transporter substrate-binding protein [Kosmotoga pacifica]|uniref:ABC transporter substrate-binding protein n=1 Tax=Kosmotoga pacifica TaxID=1330330 RepID=A0A0G2Z7F0_9BACT|nr:sugar ABC transporter substrate-binding protein [Kosmotoga pacifica]AKI97520.1 ABC transporter substrate-binding protein [Kosmotoga pacifica]
MKKFTILLVIVLMLALSITAFAKRVQIKLWFHSGRGSERAVIEDQVKRFNAMQDEIEIIAIQLPEGSYNDQVNAAALANGLPDILDLDGPYVSNYAWAGYLYPLDEFISPELKKDFLPSIISQGLYSGSIYALGTFDSGLAIWGNREYLEKIDARIPKSVDDAWTFEEFMDILRKLKELPEIKYPLDMKINYGVGEWYTYGFSPIFQAFGADLIDRSDYMSADGILNGPEALAAAAWFQALFAQGFVNSNPPGDNEFIEGKAALSWVGHWVYNQYKTALGDKLVLIPMPKFFKQATGMGSWAWSITTNSKHPEAAWKFLEFILRPEEILKMTNANGAVPSRKSAIALSPLYGEGGPLNIFVQQLETIAVPRPVTPAYPTITAAFAKAIDNIINGSDIREELNRATKEINEDIEYNEGYPVY